MHYFLRAFPYLRPYWLFRHAQRLSLAFHDQRRCLLRQVVHQLDAHRWGKALDSGWSDWDLEIYCQRLTVVQVATAEEDHGSGKCLIRVRYRLRPGGSLAAAGVVAFLAGGLAACTRIWPAGAVAGGLLASGLLLWWRGTRRAARAVSLFDQAAADLEALRL